MALAHTQDITQSIHKADQPMKKKCNIVHFIQLPSFHTKNAYTKCNYSHVRTYIVNSTTKNRKIRDKNTLNSTKFTDFLWPLALRVCGYTIQNTHTTHSPNTHVICVVAISLRCPIPFLLVGLSIADLAFNWIERKKNWSFCVNRIRYFVVFVFRCCCWSVVAGVRFFGAAMMTLMANRRSGDVY